MNSSASSEYWNEMWDRRVLNYEPQSLGFTDLFQRHIVPGGECFEIGCYPGGYLIHLSTQFAMRAHGIDMYPATSAELPPHLRRYGANVGEIMQGDFFTLDTARKYDLVCSFGFVEHFFNFEEVIKKHCELVKPGGLLIVTCPNFRRIQFVLHWLFDHASLRKHVLSAMDLDRWGRAIAESGLEVVEKGYYGKFLFWVESTSRISRWFAKWIARVGGRLARGMTRSNGVVSPFMFCIARKPVVQPRSTTAKPADAAGLSNLASQ
jgi:SAM-dependent methyltransferase